MITLVCNAAEGCLDLILGRDAGILAARQWDTPTRATETLAPGLNDLLRESGLGPTDVERMACVRGPGSFTGIRLVLATAAALRRVLHIPVAGLDFMQALALRACEEYPTAARVGVITHARRDLVHYQAFARTAALPAPLAGVELIPPADAAQRLRDDRAQAVIGSALARHAVLADAGLPACAATQPQATDLWALAQAASYAHEDIEPLYVRPCDAVDNLDHIARKQGMDPAAAHERLNALLSAPPPI